MNKLLTLTKRNLKEIIRDPLSLIFCLGFPLVMLVLLQTIFKNMQFVPDNFKIENYAVGICIFGYTFGMMFIAMMISADKNSEFICRINIAPIGKTHYVLSYALCAFPIFFAQTLLFLLVATLFGLSFSFKILVATVYLIPSMILFISIGILMGTIAKNEKQSGPLCSIIISASSILGGVFMPVEGLGTFSNIVNILPFVHSVKISSGVFLGDYSCIFPHVIWVLGYAIIFFLATLVIRKIKSKRS